MVDQKHVDVHRVVGFGLTTPIVVGLFSTKDKVLLRTYVSGECPPNWVVSNSGTSCYFISYIQLNFTDANLWCMENQGRLMEILNENIFLALQSIKKISSTLNSFYWVGLREIGANKSEFFRTIKANFNEICLKIFIIGLHHNRHSFNRTIFVLVNLLIHIIIIFNNMINALVCIFNQILPHVYAIQRVQMSHHFFVN